MVFDRYVASIISSYLGNFIKNVNKETVKVSLLRGSIELTDVELLPTLFDFNDFVQLKRGTIGYLSVKIPWRNLYNNRCEIHIKNVCIVLETKTKTSRQEADVKAKLEGIARLESTDTMSEEDEKDSPEEETKEGFLKRLQKRILNNFAFFVENVSFRLEDNIGLWKGMSVAIVGNIQSVQCEATDSAFQPAFLTNSTGEFFRALTYSGIAASIRCAKSNARHPTDWNSLSIKEFSRRCSITEGFSPLLFPSDGHLNVNYVLDKVGENQRPYVKLVFLVKTGNVSISDEVILAVRALLHSLQHCPKITESRRPSARPTARDGEDMQWWKYLFMELRERRKKKFDWTQYKKWKAAYRDYFIFSLKQYKVEWSNGFELNENVEQAKCLLSLADVAECRKRARFTAQTYTDGNALPSWIDSPNFFNEEIPRGRFMASDVPFDILLVLSWPSFRLEVGHDFHLEISNFSLALSDKDKILVVDAGISKVSLVASSNELLCLQHPVENGISLQCDFNKGNNALSTNLRVRHTKLVYNTTIHTFVIDKLAHYLQLDLFDFQSNPAPKKAVSSDKPAVSLFPENKFRVRVDGITAVVDELTLNVERISVTHETPIGIHIARVTAITSSSETLLSAEKICISPFTEDGTITVKVTPKMDCDLEEIASLKEFLGFLKDSTAQILPPSKPKKKEKDSTPAKIKVLFPSAQFNQLKLHNLAVDIFLLNGWYIHFVADGAKTSTFESPNAHLDLELWADGCLDMSPFADCIDDDGIGFSFAMQDTTILLNDEIAGTAESLFDLLMLLIFADEDPRVYLRDESKTTPHIRGKVACSNSHLILVDDTGVLEDLQVDAEGTSSLFITVDRFSDKHMDIDVSIGPMVNGFLKNALYKVDLLPKRDGAGDINVALRLNGPTPESLSIFPYSKVMLDVRAEDRVVVAHIPTIMVLWNQFNNRLLPLGRLKEIGSRVHYSNRKSRKRHRKMRSRSPPSEAAFNIGQEALAASMFGKTPPINPEPYSSPTFPGDLSLSVRIQNSELYYMWGDGSLAPLFMHTVVDNCKIYISNRDSLAKVDVSGEMFFPYVTPWTQESHPHVRPFDRDESADLSASSSGVWRERNVAPERIGEEHLRRQEEEAYHGVFTDYPRLPPTKLALKLSFVNDSRPPFENGTADEFLSVYVHGCNAGSHVMACLTEPEVAAWLTLFTFFNNDTNEPKLAHPSTINHDNNAHRQFVTRVEVAPVYVQVPSLQSVIALWDGLTMNFTLQKKCFAMPRLGVLFHPRWGHHAVPTSLLSPEYLRRVVTEDPSCVVLSLQSDEGAWPIDRRYPRWIGEIPFADYGETDRSMGTLLDEVGFLFSSVCDNRETPETMQNFLYLNECTVRLSADKLTQMRSAAFFEGLGYLSKVLQLMKRSLAELVTRRRARRTPENAVGEKTKKERVVVPPANGYMSMQVRSVKAAVMWRGAPQAPLMSIMGHITEFTKLNQLPEEERVNINNSSIFRSKKEEERKMKTEEKEKETLDDSFEDLLGSTDESSSVNRHGVIRRERRISTSTPLSIEHTATAFPTQSSSSYESSSQNNINNNNGDEIGKAGLSLKSVVLCIGVGGEEALQHNGNTTNHNNNNISYTQWRALYPLLENVTVTAEEEAAEGDTTHKDDKDENKKIKISPVRLLIIPTTYDVLLSLLSFTSNNNNDHNEIEETKKEGEDTLNEEEERLIALVKERLLIAPDEICLHHHEKDSFTTSDDSFDKTTAIIEKTPNFFLNEVDDGDDVDQNLLANDEDNMIVNNEEEGESLLQPSSRYVTLEVIEGHSPPKYKSKQNNNNNINDEEEEDVELHSVLESYSNSEVNTYDVVEEEEEDDNNNNNQNLPIITRSSTSVSVASSASKPLRSSSTASFPNSNMNKINKPVKKLSFAMIEKRASVCSFLSSSGAAGEESETNENNNNEMETPASQTRYNIPEASIIIIASMTDEEEKILIRQTKKYYQEERWNALVFSNSDIYNSADTSSSSVVSKPPCHGNASATTNNSSSINNNNNNSYFHSFFASHHNTICFKINEIAYTTFQQTNNNNNNKNKKEWLLNIQQIKCIPYHYPSLVSATGLTVAYSSQNIPNENNNTTNNKKEVIENRYRCTLDEIGITFHSLSFLAFANFFIQQKEKEREREATEETKKKEKEGAFRLYRISDSFFTFSNETFIRQKDEIYLSRSGLIFFFLSAKTNHMVVDLQHRYTIILQEDLLSYSSGHKEETCGGVWLVESGLTVSFKNGVVRLPWKYYSEKNNNNTSSKHKRSTYYKEQQTAAYLTIPQDIKEKLKRLNPGVFNHQNNNNNNTSMDFSPLLEPFMALGENSFVVCEEKNNMQLELSDGTRLTRDNMVWWSESEDTTKGNSHPPSGVRRRSQGSPLSFADSTASSLNGRANKYFNTSSPMLNRSRLAKWGSTQNIPGLLSDPNSSSHTSRKMEEEKTEEGDSRHSRARTDDGTSQNTNHNNNNSVVTTFIHWNVQKWACHVQPLREAYSLYLTTSTDGDLQLHNNTIETIEAKLNELTILSKWGNQEKEGSSNNDSTPILSPVSIVVRQMNSKVNHNHITRTVFFGEVFMDITRSDVLLFYHITSEFSFIMNEQLRYCLCSAGEKEYRKIVAGLLDWKKRQRATLPPQESNKKNEKNNLKSAGAVLQVKVPTAEITFSDPRYPLLKMTASTVVLEYLQQQQQQEKGEKAGQSSPVDTITFMTSEVGVSIFGQGRWDVLLKPLGHLMFTRTTRVGRIPNETNYPHPSPSESSCLVQSTTLYGGGIQLHCSRLLLNKVQYVNREMQLLFEKPASLAWMADSETAEAVLTSLLKRRARQQQSSSRRNSRVDHFSSSKTTQVVDLRRHRPLRPDEDTASSANSGLEDEEEYDEDDEYPLSVLPGVTSSSRYTNHSSSSTRRATHRFLNIFQCGFYLVVCKADGSQTSEDNIGQVCYLPPSASIDLFIPYKQASQMMIYFYPENGGYYDEDEDQYRLNETVLQSLSNSANNKKENAAVNVAELKYGNALGLVVEDLLVVLTCKGTQDSGMTADDNRNNKTNNATASTSNVIGTTPVMWIDEKVMQSVLEKRRNAKKGEPVNNNNNNITNGEDSATSAPRSSYNNNNSSSTTQRKALEEGGGLVVINVHAKTALRNESGVVLFFRQHLMNDEEEEEDHYRNTNREPLSELLPGDHFPLKGTCSRLTLRVQQGDLVYECNYNYSLMGAQPGGFIALHPIRRRSPSPPRREASPANPNHNAEADGDAYYCPPVRPSSMDQRPLVLFVAHQHYAESLSTTITFFPRLSVINHTGVPIRFAMFQQDPRAGPQLASHDRRLLQPWIPKETKQQMEKEPMYQPLVALTAHGRLYHQQCIPVLQCTYNSNLVMGLSLEQTTGNVLGSREVQEVVHHLREAVDHHPRMLQLYDSAGRSFYVQVNVLPRTIILSVALWVSNLTNYPLVLTESLLTRRVSAGQDSNVGIVPSQGEPFLIGCRMQEFTQVFFRIGLDGGWSSAVQVEVGSAGVFESISADGVPRSCNYVIQIPNPLEGRPIVLRITPRWVFVNTTAKKRLQIYVDCPLFSKAVRAARKDKARLAALQAMSSFPLNPGEHFVSCVGQIEGNRFSLRERLEGMLPSVTSITGEGVQHRDMTLYYEAQRTDFMSIDFPGETNVNLWAARRLRGRQTAVALGAPLEVYKPDRFDPIALEPFDPYASTESVVTGRLSITIQNKENVLTMLLGGVEATQISIQNRLLAQTVIIRQRGIRRRNTVPPCQNRFYLWEDDRSEHVLSIHIDGYKGQWFEVDFSGGDCVVSRHATPSLRHPLLNRPPPMYGANEEAMRIGYEAQRAAVHLPFYVGGFTTKHESGRIVVMITDTPVPLNATISQRRIPRHASYTLHVSFLKFVYLCEATVLAKYQHYQLAKSAAGAKARRRSHAADKKTEENQDVIVHTLEDSHRHQHSLLENNNNSITLGSSTSRRLVSVALEGIHVHYIAESPFTQTHHTPNENSNNKKVFTALHRLQIIDELHDTVTLCRARWYTPNNNINNTNNNTGSPTTPIPSSPATNNNNNNNKSGSERNSQKNDWLNYYYYQHCNNKFCLTGGEKTDENSINALNSFLKQILNYEEENNNNNNTNNEISPSYVPPWYVNMAAPPPRLDRISLQFLQYYFSNRNQITDAQPQPSEDEVEEAAKTKKKEEEEEKMLNRILAENNEEHGEKGDMHSPTFMKQAKRFLEKLKKTVMDTSSEYMPASVQHLFDGKKAETNTQSHHNNNTNNFNAIGNDFQLQFTYNVFADGVVRISECVLFIHPFHLLLNDVWIAALVEESRMMGAARSINNNNNNSNVNSQASVVVRQRSSSVVEDASSATFHRSTESGDDNSEDANNGLRPSALAKVNIVRSAVGYIPLEFIPQSQFVNRMVTTNNNNSNNNNNTTVNVLHGKGSTIKKSSTRRSASSNNNNNNETDEDNSNNRRSPTLFFIHNIYIPKLVFYVTLQRHRHPDPLRRQLGVYAVMLPTKLTRKPFSMKAFHLCYRVETISGLQSRLKAWAFLSLRSQWTKVTKIGTVLDFFRLNSESFDENNNNGNNLWGCLLQCMCYANRYEGSGGKRRKKGRGFFSYASSQPRLRPAPAPLTWNRFQQRLQFLEDIRKNKSTEAAAQPGYPTIPPDPLLDVVISSSSETDDDDGTDPSNTNNNTNHENEENRDTVLMNRRRHPNDSAALMSDFYDDEIDSFQMVENVPYDEEPQWTPTMNTNNNNNNNNEDDNVTVRFTDSVPNRSKNNRSVKDNDDEASVSITIDD